MTSSTSAILETAEEGGFPDNADFPLPWPEDKEGMPGTLASLTPWTPAPWPRGEYWKHSRELELKRLKKMLEDMTMGIQMGYLSRLSATRDQEEYITVTRRFDEDVRKEAEDWTRYRDRRLAELDSEALADRLRWEAGNQPVNLWPYGPEEVIGDGARQERTNFGGGRPGTPGERQSLPGPEWG